MNNINSGRVDGMIEEEYYYRIFRWLIDDKTTMVQACETSLEHCSMLSLVKLYRQLPEGQCKSVEDLVGWANEKGFEHPPIKDLHKALCATQESQLPKEEEDVYDFLVDYMTDIDQICALRTSKRDNDLAKDCIIDRESFPQEIFFPGNSKLWSSSALCSSIQSKITSGTGQVTENVKLKL